MEVEAEMSLMGLFNQSAEIYERRPGQEGWTKVTAEPVACRIWGLGMREREMLLSRLRQPATHKARCQVREEVKAGRFLVTADGQAFAILAVQEVRHPTLGHLILYLGPADLPERGFVAT